MCVPGRSTRTPARARDLRTTLGRAPWGRAAGTGAERQEDLAMRAGRAAVLQVGQHGIPDGIRQGVGGRVARLPLTDVKPLAPPVDIVQA